ncbi:hypothetical protein AB6A40_008063 [Gnathostoma spinigerum]|uniref:C2H2-type domain-containing protein n=1 Tax=Gnathostoma spinigerum TaxID=75299 RepID=A0ABD6ET61_9BILA
MEGVASSSSLGGDEDNVKKGECMKGSNGNENNEGMFAIKSFFLPHGDGSQCTVCQTTIKGTRTSNLYRHMRRKHSLKYDTLIRSVRTKKKAVCHVDPSRVDNFSVTPSSKSPSMCCETLLLTKDMCYGGNSSNSLECENDEVQQQDCVNGTNDEGDISNEGILAISSLFGHCEDGNKCTLCQSIIKGVKTSNLYRHVRRKHPSKYEKLIRCTKHRKALILHSSSLSDGVCASFSSQSSATSPRSLLPKRDNLANCFRNVSDRLDGEGDSSENGNSLNEEGTLPISSFFRRYENGNQCILCQATIRGEKSSNLYRHMRRKHSFEYERLKQRAKSKKKAISHDTSSILSKFILPMASYQSLSSVNDHLTHSDGNESNHLRQENDNLGRGDDVNDAVGGKGTDNESIMAVLPLFRHCEEGNQCVLCQTVIKGVRNSNLYRHIRRRHSSKCESLIRHVGTMKKASRCDNSSFPTSFLTPVSSEWPSQCSQVLLSADNRVSPCSGTASNSLKCEGDDIERKHVVRDRKKETVINNGRIVSVSPLFRRFNDGNQCKLCQTTIKGIKTSNLFRHMRRKHVSTSRNLMRRIGCCNEKAGFGNPVIPGNILDMSSPKPLLTSAHPVCSTETNIVHSFGTAVSPFRDVESDDFQILPCSTSCLKLSCKRALIREANNEFNSLQREIGMDTSTDLVVELDDKVFV